MWCRGFPLLGLSRRLEIEQDGRFVFQHEVAEFCRKRNRRPDTIVQSSGVARSRRRASGRSAQLLREPDVVPARQAYVFQTAIVGSR